MTWYPLAFLPPQFENTTGVPYSGAVLKAYAAGTNDNIPLATDYTGATTAASMVLNAAGYITHGGAIVIPHLQENYKLALYANQAAADADSGAIWSVDDNQIAASTNVAFVEYFDGDNVLSTFTLSEDLGNDEKALMVFADRPLPDYVTNGTFATDTVWTKGAGWVIAAGVATATLASSDLEETLSPTLMPGQSYTLVFTITRSAGDVTPKIGGTAGTTRNSSGTYTETIVAGSSSQLIEFTGNGFTGTVDTVSVKPTYAALRQIVRPDEYTLVGNQLTLSFVPPTGTKNVIVYAPSLLLGAANDAAAAAATSEANALASAAAAAASETAAGVSETNAAASEAAAAVSEANAAASEAAAAAAAAGGLYGNILTIAFADSPFTPALAAEGTLYRCDATGGAIVINLSALSVYAEDTKFAFVKVDAGVNTVTINRGGTDTIDGGTSVVQDTQYEVNAYLGDLGSGTWSRSVQTTGIANGSVTLAKLANIDATTNGKVIGKISGNGVPVLVDILDEDAMSSNSASALPTQQSVKAYVDTAVDAVKVVSATQNTTSGTAFDFTGIPSTVTQIDVVLIGVSLSGTDNLLVQIGDGAVVTSGYSSSSDLGGAVTSTAGFIAKAGSAGSTYTGVIHLRKIGGSSWVASGAVRVPGGTDLGGALVGHVSLSGALDRVRLTRTGTDTFDLGSAVIHYI